MRVREILEAATVKLSGAGIDDSRSEARRILCWALEVDLAALIGLEHVDPASQARFEAAVSRRAAREPCAFITGSVGFWDQTLAVDRHTLIPRADSETLLTGLLKCAPDIKKPYRILDLGTGTGCLLLAALGLYPYAVGVGIDRIFGAAQLARDNARRNGLAARATFVTGSWGSAVKARFDIILSNPPYIRHADIKTLMPEVAKHEPASALDGGPDGLDAYRAIAAQLPELLSENGLAILELGAGQVKDVVEIAGACGIVETARFDDLGGITRALVLQRA